MTSRSACGSDIESYRYRDDQHQLSPSIPQMARKVLEESFSNRIRSLIRSNTTHDPGYYNITPHVDGVGTTQVSVLAEDGTAVSATSSINHMSVIPEETFGVGGISPCSCNVFDGSAHSFGSACFSPRTGIILNNQLADFCGRVRDILPGNSL